LLQEVLQRDLARVDLAIDQRLLNGNGVNLQSWIGCIIGTISICPVQPFGETISPAMQRRKKNGERSADKKAKDVAKLTLVKSTIEETYQRKG